VRGHVIPFLIKLRNMKCMEELRVSSCNLCTRRSYMLGFMPWSPFSRYLCHTRRGRHQTGWGAATHRQIPLLEIELRFVTQSLDWLSCSGFSMGL